KPDEEPNPINPKSNGLVPVAILGSETFDVSAIDPSTLAFGPAGATPVHDLSDLGTKGSHLEDINEDGFIDLVTHYRQKQTGLLSGDTEACLTADFTSGLSFTACDSVEVK
ncbi:MAG: hypothetical protein ACE5Q6_25165, partial [Dehalococcoidia bacterium]